MTDMTAAVVLRMVDELTGPARKIQSTLRGIVKDVEKLNKLTGKVGGAKQFDGLTSGIKQATSAARELRKSMATPIGRGFVKPAVSSIDQVTRSANSASNAIGRMNAAMRRTPAAGRGQSRGSGSPFGGHGGGHSWKLRHTIGHAFAASGVYATVHGGIHSLAEGVREGFKQSFDLQHTKAMLRMQGEGSETVNDVVKRAREMAQQIPTFTTAQHAAAIAELRPAMIGGIRFLGSMLTGGRPTVGGAEQVSALCVTTHAFASRSRTDEAIARAWAAGHARFIVANAFRSVAHPN